MRIHHGRVLALVVALAGCTETPSTEATTPVESTVAPPTSTAPTEPTSNAMWPQATVEEVREAQGLADAADPTVTWQLEPDLEQNVIWTLSEVPEIFARFLQEELGWEEYAEVGGTTYGLLESGQETIGLTYVRCAPGESDPFYPGEPRVGGCVPTMDELRYETVLVSVAQPGRQGPSGIWVVTSSELVEPIEQVVPLTDMEVEAILGAFLLARIEGEGAEQYLGGVDGRARLLYTTTTGATYERSVFESLERPNWPNGLMRFEVRLIAEDDTVVEQSFMLVRDATGNWALEPETEIFENGRALPSLYDILGGEVTFSIVDPWEGSFFGPMFETAGEAADARFDHPGGSIYFLADPVSMAADCQEGPAAANAEALAQSILSNDDFETSALSTATIGGAPALYLDVALAAEAEAAVCEGSGRWALSTSVFEFEPGRRVRLYLIDLPGGSARILSIAIASSEDQFESVVEAAAPILDSIEFHGE